MSEVLAPTNISNESSKISFRKEQNKQPSRIPLGPDLENYGVLGGMSQQKDQLWSMLKVRPLLRGLPRAVRGQSPGA